MAMGGDSSSSNDCSSIDSSNIGFQVRLSSSFSFFAVLLVLSRFIYFIDFYLVISLPFEFDFLRNCYCSAVVIIMKFLQLLKKHGWKEGTGLGASEQVLSLVLILYLIFFSNSKNICCLFDSLKVHFEIGLQCSVAGEEI